MIQAIIEHHGKKRIADLTSPIDISIPLHSGLQNPNAFGIQPPLFEAFKAGSFIGSVVAGGSVNCENLFLNAHGNGTHTECVGHIAKEKVTINQSLQHFFSMAQLITVFPKGPMISLEEIKPYIELGIQSLVIRTLPNDGTKLTRQYSGATTYYLEPALCQWIAANHIDHLLVDLPSVDPEEDEGKLSAHHAFWQYPANPRMNATITEMIYVPNSILDGLYLLNIQIAAFESDASPSKPILYKLD